jgi:nitric oxide reductase NorQ protein
MNQRLLRQLEDWKKKYPVAESERSRVTEPSTAFIGDEILEMAVTALLEGENILLSGNKATGKNILAENLAWMFARPSYTMSFHVNTDAATLIGTDTFVDNEVRLRKGPVCLCAEYGGFGILDEINMAKSDALAVLHAALDYRRLIEVPGYQRIVMHPAARFIATQNYGYAGTRELNEALVSRFMVIQMPQLDESELMELLARNAPGADRNWLSQLARLFLELQEKAENGEISSRAVDLRGMIGALRMMADGMKPAKALDMGISGKCFDPFERQLVQDVIRTRFPATLNAGSLFTE